MFLGLIVGCKTETPEWKFSSSIDLDTATPIGITILDNHIWIADGDNNQIIHLDIDGKILFKEEGFERPMHISNDGESLLVPEYGIDQITIFNSEGRSKISLVDSLDAPAGIHFENGKYAIADFYNHRILYGAENDWLSFGMEGKGDGEFYYPTDVHIFEGNIYVADAYNNRVQVFDENGVFVRTFGKEEKMSASTGIYVSDNSVFISDFENDRVLIYNLEGVLIQIIDEGLAKPTDVIIFNDELLITNYSDKSISKFKI